MLMNAKPNKSEKKFGPKGRGQPGQKRGINQSRRLATCLCSQGVLWFLFLALFAAALHFVLALSPFPDLDAFLNRSYGLVINDRNGEALRVLPAADGVKREWAPLNEIPSSVIKIFIRAEDRRFYFHPGVDFISVAGSAFRNIKAGRIVSGASTISMQLARLVKRPGAGMKGKIAEAFDALRLEARLSKKEILELWLNNIPFGSNIEGVAAMARARFGRPVSALDDSRSALLAVVPRRPFLYDPAINPDAAVRSALALSERCRLALREEDLRVAAMEAQAGAVAETFGGNTGFEKAPFHAPHFTERVAKMIRYEGSIPPLAAGLLVSASLPVHSINTTLDLKLQNYAEKLLESELALLSDNRVSNGAILAIDNATGDVRIYAGSSSWFNDADAGKIDGVQARSQPGSCLKPFLYALALDSGFTPADVLPDLPTVFGSREAYVPSNFNSRFNGPVRFRVALASSLNIPAVYLLERLGVDAFENYLEKLGFVSIAETRGTHGTGLALGNAEVSLEELVRGFSVFPRGGSPAQLQWIEGGNAGDKTKPEMSAYAAWVITDILSDRSSRFIGFGPAPSLATPFASMFKTGTANQYQHIWALGATARFTVGVWMGNFSGATVVGRTGSSIPARIAAKLLAAMEEESGGHAAGAKLGERIPSAAGEARICALSGEAAGPYCPGALGEWLPVKADPGACTWHTAQGVFYPPEYQSWLAERFRSGIVRRESGGFIRMPLRGSVFYLDPGMPPEAQALRIETAGFGHASLVYLDGALQGSLNYAGVYALPVTRGKHTVYVEDESGRAASVDFEVR
jgi:penicillin-binding protein 1C